MAVKRNRGDPLRRVYLVCSRMGAAIVPGRYAVGPSWPAGRQRSSARESSGAQGSRGPIRRYLLQPAVDDTVAHTATLPRSD